MKNSSFQYASDNGNLTFANWAWNQPNDARGQEDCANYRLTWDVPGAWVDSPCSEESFSICARNATIFEMATIEPFILF